MRKHSKLIRSILITIKREWGGGEIRDSNSKEKEKKPREKGDKEQRTTAAIIEITAATSAATVEANGQEKEKKN